MVQYTLIHSASTALHVFAYLIYLHFSALLGENCSRELLMTITFWQVAISTKFIWLWVRSSLRKPCIFSTQYSVSNALVIDKRTYTILLCTAWLNFRSDSCLSLIIFRFWLTSCHFFQSANVCISWSKFVLDSNTCTSRTFYILTWSQRTFYASHQTPTKSK